MSEDIRNEKCTNCDGEGKVICETGGDHTCGNCEQGSVWSSAQDKWVECPECDGPHSIACDEDGCDGSERDCEKCDGSGIVEAA